VTNETEIAQWVIQQDTRITRFMPYALMGGLLLLGILLSVVKGLFSLSERAVLMGGGLPGAALLIGGAAFFIFGRQGMVEVSDAELRISRPIGPAQTIQIGSARMEAREWVSQTREVTEISSGIQLRVEGEGGSIWLGGSGNQLVERAREAGLEDRSRPPDIVLEEADLLELLSHLQPE